LKERGIPTTNQEFRYTSSEISSNVVAIRVGNSETGSFIDEITDPSLVVGIILDSTNFYAEGGGQIFDTGSLVKDDLYFSVTEVQSFGGYVVHIGSLRFGKISVGDSVSNNVNNERREPIMSNHTATHLLNFALKEVVGEGCDQKGSLVVEDKFRFDFSYYQKISNEDLQRLDELVNELIAQELPVYASVVPLEQAQQIPNVRRMFGEKYPDPVRLISIGADIIDVLKTPNSDAWSKYSMEYCGGTHVANTRDIHAFTITEEIPKGSGERRITAITGDLAKKALREYDRLLHEIEVVEKIGNEDLNRKCLEFESDLLKTLVPAYLKNQLRTRLDVLKAEADHIYKEKLKNIKKSGGNLLQDIINQFSDESVRFAVAEYDVDGNNKLLVDTANQIRDSIERDVAVMLISPFPKKDRITYVASVNEGLHGSLTAQAWVAEVSNVFGGKGGGKAGFAQGYHEQMDQVETSLNVACDFAAKRLNL